MSKNGNGSGDGTVTCDGYQDGYNAGYQAGLDAGFEAGGDLGRAAGYKDGYGDGFDVGQRIALARAAQVAQLIPKILALTDCHFSELAEFLEGLAGRGD